MKIKDKNNKFDQISGIFSQFSEENKDKLLETAQNLLKVQMDGLTSITASNNEIIFKTSSKRT
jgi:hypothetical protein